jgi:pimeloyl-ACP methyl ester carboxylesterase
MQVVVDGLLTNYQITGTGKPVLVLHGWADSMQGWRSFSQKLAAQGYEIIVCDLPGFGGTDAPSMAWDSTDYARFVSEFLHKINRQPYGIIGHSNGGAIAVRGLGRGLLNAGKLVLLASAGVREGESRKGLKTITKIGKVLAAPLPNSVRSKMRQALYTKVGSDMLVAEHLQETFKRIVMDDVCDDAARISLPTLLMYGSADKDTPVRYGEKLQQSIDGSELVVLPDIGHFIHLDAEQKVIEHVGAFLQ